MLLRIPMASNNGQQQQLGSMTVNFKMNVTTSGVHEGLLITTGIQTGNAPGFSCLSGKNGGGALPWWQSMGGGEPSVAQSADATAIEAQRPNQLTDSPATVATSTIIPTARSPMPTQTIATLLNTSEEQEKKRTMEDRLETRTINKYNTTSSTVSTTGQPPSPKLKSQGSTSNPIHCSSLSRLSNGRHSPYEPTSFKLNVFDSGNPVELSFTSKKDENKSEHVLNDTTTTTTTLEVFRGRLGEEPVDFFKLPPEPFSQDGKPQIIRAHGPAYEVSSRTDTHFGGLQESPPKPQFRTFSPESDRPYFVTEPSNTSSLNRTYSRLHLEHEQTRPSSAYSTPGSSRWNLQSTSFENATILRRQRSQRSEQKLYSTPPQQSQLSNSNTANYSQMDQRERMCPPLPPKKYALRHTTSQPNIVGQGPPRPVTSKPNIRSTIYPQCYGLYKDRHSHSRSFSRTRSSEPRAYIEENPYEDIKRSDVRKDTSSYRPKSSTGVAYSEANQLMGNKAGLSASSNEIFKLYQTRDCLGNVLYEYRPKNPLHHINGNLVEKANCEQDITDSSLESPFTNRTDLSMLKIEELEEDIPLASSEDSSFCTDNFSPRFELNGSRFTQQMDGFNLPNKWPITVKPGGNEDGSNRQESSEKQLDVIGLPISRGALLDADDNTVNTPTVLNPSTNNNPDSVGMCGLPPSGRPPGSKKKVLKTSVVESCHFPATFDAYHSTIHPSGEREGGLDTKPLEANTMQEYQREISKVTGTNDCFKQVSIGDLQELECEPKRISSATKNAEKGEEKTCNFKLAVDDFRLKVIAEELDNM